MLSINNCDVFHDSYYDLATGNSVCSQNVWVLLFVDEVLQALYDVELLYFYSLSPSKQSPVLLIMELRYSKFVTYLISKFLIIMFGQHCLTK